MGKSVARQLAEKGANVIIVARDKAKLKDAIVYISVRAISALPKPTKSQWPRCRKAP